MMLGVGKGETAQEEGVYLVGTVHLDWASAPVLQRLLCHLSPCALTVEISRFSVEYRGKMEAAWIEALERVLESVPEARGHFRIELLRRQLAMPYEWTTSLKYAESHSIPCLAIDSGKLAKKELPLWMDQLISGRNIKHLVSEPDRDIEDYFALHRKKALESFTQPNFGSSSPQFHQDSFWTLRENILRKRVERLCKKFKKIVHVGGWTHMIPNEDGRLAKGLLTVLKGIFFVSPQGWISLPLRR